IGDTLAEVAPDVALLTEIDKGMARSGNGHRVAELAARFGWNYAYGVEFIELDHGNPEERAAHAGETDLSGFHGNGIISGLPLLRPFMVRLEAEGTWFGRARGEPRVGGRMAIGGQVELGGRRVTLVAVHLESNSDPEHRAGQVAHLLGVIQRYDAEAPILIGGDLNTSTFSFDERRNPEIVAAALAADPFRRVRVAAYEPLFALMESRGFGWKNCNVPDAVTQRVEQPDPAARSLGKIDWFFSRGLKTSLAAVIPAIQADGRPFSDHECLVVEIELAD
ncbi:MAG TPA: endonuclease, partial [Devosiaceae bacterium]|nr:endonuclease [Devosiaceae bacterium]